jgi:Uma2 family endonuclease
MYPDATVICGRPVLDRSDPHQETVINPRVIVEVLSPSTESYDRRDKFDSYRQIDSMGEYVLVSQDTPRIEVLRRQADGSWAITVFSGMDATATLQSIEVELPLNEAYAGVEFPAQGEASGATNAKR